MSYESCGYTFELEPVQELYQGRKVKLNKIIASKRNLKYM